MSDSDELTELRLQRLGTALDVISAGHREVSARLDFLDKQMSIMTRDMRSLRHSVVSLQVAQDQKLQAIEARLAEMKAIVETGISLPEK